MPTYFNYNGEKKRFWSDPEMLDRYRQGQEDAGNKNSANQYTTEDLKKSYDAGIELADKILGAAIRSGFEEGHKQGELSGIELGKIEANRSIPQNIIDAQRKGHQQGYTLGLKEGKDTTEAAFQASDEKRKKSIIQEYLREHSWHGRAVKAYDEFISQRQQGNLTAVMHFIGKIPVGSIGDSSGSRYQTYRLHNVRTAPTTVFSLLAWNLVIKPFVAYHVLKYPYRWIADYHGQYSHGETDNQFNTRKTVERSCADIDKINPGLFNKTAFSTEEEHRIAACKSQCQEAMAGYQTMIKTMDFRRKREIGEQKFYGLRLFGSHRDVYAETTNQSDGTNIIASIGPAAENDQLVADLSGVKLKA